MAGNTPDVRILVGNLGDASPSGQSASLIRKNLETALAGGIKIRIVPDLSGVTSSGGASWIAKGLSSLTENANYAKEQITLLGTTFDTLKQKIASLNNVNLRNTATTELQQQYDAIKKQLIEYSLQSDNVTARDKENIQQRISALNQLAAQYVKLDATQTKSANYIDKQIASASVKFDTLKQKIATLSNVDLRSEAMAELQQRYDVIEKELTEYSQRSTEVTALEKENIKQQIAALSQLVNQYTKLDAAQTKAETSNVGYAEKQLISLSARLDTLKQKIASFHDTNLQSVASTELQQQYDAIERELSEYASRSSEVTAVDKENIRQRIAAMAQLVASYEKLDVAQAKSASYVETQKYKAASAINGLSTFDTVQAQQALQIQQNLNAKLDEYAARKTEITSQEKVWVQEQIAAIKRLVAEQDKITANADKVAASQNMQIASLNQYLTTVNPKALTEFSGEITRIRTLLASGVPGDAQKASAAITQLKANIKAAGYEGGNAVTYLVAKLKTFATYLASSMLTMGIISGIRNMITNVKDLDAALTDLRIVTGSTREETQELLETYNQMAQQLGSTTVDTAQGAIDWLRQGYSDEDAKELLTQSMTLSIVGDMDSASATDALTAAMKGNHNTSLCVQKCA